MCDIGAINRMSSPPELTPLHECSEIKQSLSSPLLHTIKITCQSVETKPRDLKASKLQV